MSSLFQAVLFDLDGTLLHTVPDLAESVNAMLLDLGRHELSLEQVSTWVGKGSESLIHRSLTGQLDGRAEPELFEKAHALWSTHYQRCNGLNAQFYPHVREGLQALFDAGIKMAVVTNKPHAFTVPLLQRTSIAHYFSVVVSGDTCTTKKPDPQPVLHACERLGVSPSQALFIGDSTNDAQAARAAGVPCWLLPYGYNEGHDIAGVSCDEHIDSVLHAAQRILLKRED